MGKYEYGNNRRYKGCQKKIIMLKNTGSALFDEAYFILKDAYTGLTAGSISENDMVTEANRIINENMIAGRQYPVQNENKDMPKKFFFRWYIAGALSSAGILSFLYLFCETMR